MSIDKTDSPDPLIAGTDITYTLHANNDGPSTAPNVAIRDFLPDSVAVLSVTEASVERAFRGFPATRCIRHAARTPRSLLGDEDDDDRRPRQAGRSQGRGQRGERVE